MNWEPGKCSNDAYSVMAVSPEDKGTPSCEGEQFSTQGAGGSGGGQLASGQKACLAFGLPRLMGREGGPQRSRRCFCSC